MLTPVVLLGLVLGAPPTQKPVWTQAQARARVLQICKLFGLPVPFVDPEYRPEGRFIRWRGEWRLDDGRYLVTLVDGTGEISLLDATALPEPGKPADADRPLLTDPQIGDAATRALALTGGTAELRFQKVSHYQWEYQRYMSHPPDDRWVHWIRESQDVPYPGQGASVRIDPRTGRIMFLERHFTTMPAAASKQVISEAQALAAARERLAGTEWKDYQLVRSERQVTSPNRFWETHKEERDEPVGVHAWVCYFRWVPEPRPDGRPQPDRGIEVRVDAGTGKVIGGQPHYSR